MTVDGQGIQIPVFFGKKTLVGTLLDRQQVHDLLDRLSLGVGGGLSLRQAAGQIGLTYHQARKLLHQVHGVIQSQTLLVRKLPVPVQAS